MTGLAEVLPVVIGMRPDLGQNGHWGFSLPTAAMGKLPVAWPITGNTVTTKGGAIQVDL
jgi:hypothetical protein